MTARWDSNDVKHKSRHWPRRILRYLHLTSSPECCIVVLGGQIGLSAGALKDHRVHHMRQES